MNTSIKDEFVGKDLEIVRSNNKSLTGIHGTIIDETKNAFKILVVKNNKESFIKVLKSVSTFKIDGTLFEGTDIMKRPEDRIKLKR